jgi:hypothetical protein
VQGAKLGHAPVGRQPGDLGGERRPVVPAGEVGLDRAQLRVSAEQHRPVVRVGGGKGRLVELLPEQPAFVRVGPGARSAAPDPAVAQQELRQPVPGPGPVFDHVGTGAAQIPHGFLLDGRDANGDQLAGAVQPGQPAAVPRIGLDPIPGAVGDQRRRDHLAADAHVGKQPGELEPVGPAS